MFRSCSPEKFLLLSPHVALYGILLGGSAWILIQLRAISEETFRPLATIAAMATFGPAIFYLHWPYLWHHPVDRTASTTTHVRRRLRKAEAP